MAKSLIRISNCLVSHVTIPLNLDKSSSRGIQDFIQEISGRSTSIYWGFRRSYFVICTRNDGLLCSVSSAQSQTQNQRYVKQLRISMSACCCVVLDCNVLMLEQLINKIATGPNSSLNFTISCVCPVLQSRDCNTSTEPGRTVNSGFSNNLFHDSFVNLYLYITRLYTVKFTEAYLIYLIFSAWGSTQLIRDAQCTQPGVKPMGYGKDFYIILIKKPNVLRRYNFKGLKYVR